MTNHSVNGLADLAGLIAPGLDHQAGNTQQYGAFDQRIAVGSSKQQQSGRKGATEPVKQRAKFVSGHNPAFSLPHGQALQASYEVRQHTEDSHIGSGDRGNSGRHVMDATSGRILGTRANDADVASGPSSATINTAYGMGSGLKNLSALDR